MAEPITARVPSAALAKLRHLYQKQVDAAANYDAALALVVDTLGVRNEQSTNVNLDDGTVTGASAVTPTLETSQ